MKPLFVALVVAVPFAIAQAPKEDPPAGKDKGPATWKSRTITAGDIKCEVEAPWDLEPQPAKKEAGTEIHMLLCKEADDRAYMVAINKLPGKLTGDAAQAAFKAGYEEARKKLEFVDGTQSFGPSKLDPKYPLAKECVAAFFEFAVKEPKSFYRAKLVLHEDVLFQVVVMGPKDWAKDKEAGDRFLQSFRPAK